MRSVRTGASLSAAAVVAAAWLGPLPGLALERFAAQAALHVVLVSIAGPLLAMCVAGSRIDPVRRWPHGFSPLGLSLLQAGVVWAWHMPIAQLAARAEPSLLWLQQISLLLAGLLLWVSVLGGDRATRYERVGAGIIALLMTSISMTLLGGLSLIARSPYFGAEIAASFDDRRLGALLILGGAAVIYAIAGVLLLAWLLKPGPTVAPAASPGITTAGGRS
ncbi:MAG TPA: cytochrome c oxidase assembly protein [Gammaproteobacteria bacterium]